MKRKIRNWLYAVFGAIFNGLLMGFMWSIFNSGLYAVAASCLSIITFWIMITHFEVIK